MVKSKNAAQGGLLSIDGGEVLTPEGIMNASLVCGGRQILGIDTGLSVSGLPVERLQAENGILVPGLVDGLAHITGGGGEGGFATRTPEMSLVDAIAGGVTTLVGALGTDAVTQTLPALLAKARALNSGGLTCYCYTGSYQVPVRTLLGGIQDDIVLVDRFLGVGEVAISDHRSSHPSREELIRLAAEARVGGMLSGKAGIVLIHTGDGAARLNPLREAAQHSDIPLTQFWPTHINRNRHLLNDGIRFAREGGLIDFTASTTPELIAAGDLPCAEALPRALAEGAPLPHITFTSDGHASLPVFDAYGQLSGLQVGRMDSLLTAVRACVQEAGLSLSQALAPVTVNPARILKFADKGRLVVGADADVLVLDRDSLALRHVIAGGRVMMRDGEMVQRGYFD